MTEDAAHERVQQEHRQQRHPHPADELRDDDHHENRQSKNHSDEADQTGNEHLGALGPGNGTAQNATPVADHGQLAQRERQEHTHQIQLNELGGLCVRDEDDEHRRARQHEDAVGERHAVSAGGHLLGQQLVAGQARSQDREALDGGVRRNQEDER